MNLDHGGNHIPRNEGVTHASGCLYDAIAYVTHGEDTGFAAGFKDSVADLGNQGFEMEGTGVPHAPSAFDQHLRLGEIFFSPVHSQAKGVALVVVCSELLAAQLPLIACHSLLLVPFLWESSMNGCAPQTR